MRKKSSRAFLQFLVIYRYLWDHWFNLFLYGSTRYVILVWYHPSIHFDWFHLRFMSEYLLQDSLGSRFIWGLFRRAKKGQSMLTFKFLYVLLGWKTECVCSKELFYRGVVIEISKIHRSRWFHGAYCNDTPG